MAGSLTELSARAEPRAPSDTFGAAWMMTAAAVLIGVGTVASNADAATVIIVVSLAATTFALLDPTVRALKSLGKRPVVTVLAVAIALEAITLPTRAPIASVWYVTAHLVLAAIGLHALLFAKRWRFVQLVLVAAGHFAVMAWMISAGGLPDIDVYVIQQEGAAALLHGVNPFGLTFELVQPPGSPPVYAPEVIEGDRLNFGFIYPPLSLLMAVPGYAIAGDYRYGAAAALAVAAVIIAAIRPGQLGTGAALLVLFAPMTQQVLFWGWTDPFVILLLAITIFLASRQAATTPIGLGLLIASKQYMAPLVLLGAVLLRQVRARVGWPAILGVPVGVATLTVLPFLLWDAGALIYSTVTVHLLQPFRPDSLSIPAMLVRAGFEELPSVVGFLLAGAVFALVAWRAERTPSGFCVATAVFLMVFFLFGKQAFLHYYFLVLAVLACGIAATHAEEPLAPAR